METLKEFHYSSTYELADLIDGSVKEGISFWNYNEDYFINASCKFSKDTLLHLYIVITALNYYTNYYRRYYRKYGEFDEPEEHTEKWYKLFETYNIQFRKFKSNSVKPFLFWFEKNHDNFLQLFDRMAEEVFYILFANRSFLLDFNNIVAQTVLDTEYPAHLTTKKGTLKRTAIPQWVKKAVYHREKGRCVFCNCDLTGLINIYNNSNYDHIVPLDLYGANDPCNIQLSCESCNRSKTNKEGTTSNRYMPWWTR